MSTSKTAATYRDQVTGTGRPLLLTCQVKFAPGLNAVHPCAKAHKALTSAGVEHDLEVFGRGHPMGIATSGSRPELKELSGQEKLPVLLLPSGEAIADSGKIIAWAKSQR